MRTNMHSSGPAQWGRLALIGAVLMCLSVALGCGRNATEDAGADERPPYAQTAKDQPYTREQAKGQRETLRQEESGKRHEAASAESATQR
jgi:hypothetical protein